MCITDLNKKLLYKRYHNTVHKERKRVYDDQHNHITMKKQSEIKYLCKPLYTILSFTFLSYLEITNTNNY